MMKLKTCAETDHDELQLHWGVRSQSLELPTINSVELPEYK